MTDLNRQCRSEPHGTMGGCGQNVLIDTYQVFDSCRDRDCFEDIRVYLDDFGQGVIDRTTQVRTKSAEICSAAITVEPVQLSRGFFRVIVRYYVKLELEACVNPGRSQSFCGITAVEKDVVLYGGEGEVKVFRSNAVSDSFCSRPCHGEASNNLPIAVIETVDPVILGTRVIEPSSGCQCNCCCGCDDIPETVTGLLGGNINEGARYLAVSLGFFSVIRLERPEQYLINAVECSVPNKECPPTDTGSACDAFYRMAFPTEEFAPGRTRRTDFSNNCGCGCDDDNDSTPRTAPGNNGAQNNGCGCSRR